MDEHGDSVSGVPVPAVASAEATAMVLQGKPRVARGINESSICEHNRRRSRCKPCGGSNLCEHGRIKAHCKDCGGVSICEHGRLPSPTHPSTTPPHPHTPGARAHTPPQHQASHLSPRHAAALSGVVLEQSRWQPSDWPCVGGGLIVKTAVVLPFASMAAGSTAARTAVVLRSANTASASRAAKTVPSRACRSRYPMAMGSTHRWLSMRTWLVMCIAAWRWRCHRRRTATCRRSTAMAAVAQRIP